MDALDGKEKKNGGSGIRTNDHRMSPDEKWMKSIAVRRAAMNYPKHKTSFIHSSKAWQKSKTIYPFLSFLPSFLSEKE